MHIVSITTTLTFEVLIGVKVTAHLLSKDNICTKLDGYPSMQITQVIARTRNVTDGQTKCILIIPSQLRGGGLIRPTQHHMKINFYAKQF